MRMIIHHFVSLFVVNFGFFNDFNFSHLDSYSGSLMRVGEFDILVFLLPSMVNLPEYLLSTLPCTSDSASERSWLKTLFTLRVLLL